MFLRSNLQAAGLSYHGDRGQAIYSAAFRHGHIVGVVAHCWNGMVLLQAPVYAGELAMACVAASGRPVTGLSGPAEHVHTARSALRLQDAPCAVDGDEWLCAIDLANVVVPHALASGNLTVRSPNLAEHELLREWRMAYDIELLGGTDSPESRQRSAAFLDAQIAAGNVWVAFDSGRPVSLSAFNATLPDIVQLGGIYTPKEYRGRGFARVAVAASLVAARERGVSRAVLFTNSPGALRAYEAVGFERIGDYSLVLLR